MENNKQDEGQKETTSQQFFCVLAYTLLSG